MENSSFLKKGNSIKKKMQHTSVHPGTRLFIALSFLILVYRLPVSYQAIAIFLGGIIAWGVARPLPSQDPGRIFLRLWLTAGFFLTIIHCVNYNGELIFDMNGLKVAGRTFFMIGSLMVAFLWLIRTLKAEALYAMLIDLHFPISVIYIIFQAIYIIPRFGEKAKDILIAQQARGFVLKGIYNRLRAIILILAPLFSTMMYELEESSASISARGLYARGRKSHFIKINFSYLDVVLILISIIITTSLLIIIDNA